MVNTAGVISTVAGNGIAGFFGDGGPAISAELNTFVDGLAADAAGNLYIADHNNNRIRKVTPAGIISTVAGSGIPDYFGDGRPATVAGLYGPSGVAVDSFGNIYIADAVNNRIRMVDTGGIMSTVALPPLSIPEQVIVDATGNLYIADTGDNNVVELNPGASASPTVTINQAPGQADPTSTLPINFTVVFSEPVVGFTAQGITLIAGTQTITGNALGSITVTGSGTTYNVSVNAIEVAGQVIASVNGAAALSAATGVVNLGSTSTDNTVTFLFGPPTVTINQAAAQPDPADASPINFTVVFSEAVTGFIFSGVTVTGTASGTKTVIVTGSGTTYNAAVSGMTTPGTVIATVNANAAKGINSNFGNLTSTSADNTVSFTIPGFKKRQGQITSE